MHSTSKGRQGQCRGQAPFHNACLWWIVTTYCRYAAYPKHWDIGTHQIPGSQSVLNRPWGVQTDLIRFGQVARRHSKGDVLNQREGEKGVQQPNVLPNLFLRCSIDVVKVCSIKQYRTSAKGCLGKCWLFNHIQPAEKELTKPTFQYFQNSPSYSGTNSVRPEDLPFAAERLSCLFVRHETFVASRKKIWQQTLSTRLRERELESVEASALCERMYFQNVKLRNHHLRWHHCSSDIIWKISLAPNN